LRRSLKQEIDVPISGFRERGKNQFGGGAITSSTIGRCCCLAWSRLSRCWLVAHSMVKLPKLLASLSLTHFLCPLDKLPTSLEKVYLDVKTTKGDFNQPLHMSFSEINLDHNFW